MVLSGIQGHKLVQTNIMNATGTITPPEKRDQSRLQALQRIARKNIFRRFPRKAALVGTTGLRIGELEIANTAVLKRKQKGGLSEPFDTPCQKRARKVVPEDDGPPSPKSPFGNDSRKRKAPTERYELILRRWNSISHKRQRKVLSRQNKRRIRCLDTAARRVKRRCLSDPTRSNTLRRDLVAHLTALQQQRKDQLKRIRVDDFNLSAQTLADQLRASEWCDKEDYRFRRTNNRTEDEGSSEESGNEDSNSRIDRKGDSFFDDLVKSPIKALLLFYLNSGLFRFEQYKDFDAAWDDQNIDVEAVCKEIGAEKLTATEFRDLMTTFLKSHSYTSGDLMSCGACGIRLHECSGKPRVKYRRLFLNEPDAQILAYTTKQTQALEQFRHNPNSCVKIPIDDQWNTKTVEIWKAKSVFVQTSANHSSSSYWHLHPELVDSDADGCLSTLLCPTCNGRITKGRLPFYSIANGIDFGFYHRLGLTLPNLHEQLILSRSRLFFATMKVSSNTYGIVNHDIHSRFKCHAVIFPHDAPNVASYMFNPDIFGPQGLLESDSLKVLLRMFLLDPKGDPDRLSRDIYGTALIMARPWVIAQWLLVLKWLHPFYKDLDVSKIKEVEHVIQHINSRLQANAINVTDPNIIEYEQSLGADIAEVQHTDVYDTYDSVRREQETQPTVPAVQYSYMAKREQAYLCQDENDYRTPTLKDLARLKGCDLKGVTLDDERVRNMIFDVRRVDDYLHRYPASLYNGSVREPVPMGDYTSDDKGVSTCFPHVFMLGSAYHRQVGRLRHGARFHLLNQFTLVPAQDRRLLGFLYDVMLRMKVFDGVKSYVEGNNRAIQCFRDLLEHNEKKVQLLQAVSFPFGENAKGLIQKYMTHLRFAGKEVPYGAVEGSKLKHRMLGSSNRYATDSCFLTLSPTNLDNPRSIRLAFCTKANGSFPATFENQCPYGRDGVDFMEQMDGVSVLSQGVIMLPKAERARLATSNPVAFVMENRRLLYDVLNILLKMPVEDEGFYSKIEGCSERRTRYFKQRKGLLGHMLGGQGVTEDNSRGALHWHLVLAAGISPYVLQRFANMDEICKAISEVLDTMYKSSVTSNVHVASMVRRVLQKHRGSWKISDSVLQCAEPGDVLLSRARTFRAVEDGTADGPTIAAVNYATDHQAGIQNLHDPNHKDTCYKGRAGKLGCRMNMPVETCAGTVPVKLVPRTFVEEDDLDDASSTSSHSGTIAVPDEEEPSMGLSWWDRSAETEGDGSRTEGSTAASQTGEEEEEEGDGSADNEESMDSEESDFRPRSYDVVRLQDTETLPAEKRHHLCPIIDKLDNFVIVWETQRPVQQSNLFEVDLDNVPDPALYIHYAFIQLLKDVKPYSNHPSAFWRWLLEEAPLEQLREMFDEVRRQLPLANGYVAAFNPGISFCTASHNNVSLLGSTGQARSAMFYLIPYQSKSKFEPYQSLAILQHALVHIRKYKSKATDSGTVQRTVKYLLTRALNRMHLHIEISDWQIAAALLDLPSMIMSDRFAYGNPLALAALQTRMEMDDDEEHAFQRICDALAVRQSQAAGPTTMDNWLVPDEDDEGQDDGEEEGPEEMGQVVPPDGALPAASSVPVGPYPKEAVVQDLGYIQRLKIFDKASTVDNPRPPTITLIPSTATYYYRGEELKDFSLYETLACVQFVNEIPSPKEDKPLNFKTQTQFRTDPAFMGFHDSYHVLRKKQYTPLLVGSVPPHPGLPPDASSTQASRALWRERADHFARYYLALFRPKSSTDDPNNQWDQLQSWIHDLQHDGSIISKFRLMMLYQHIKGIRTSGIAAKMATEYRARKRDLWKEPERRAYAKAEAQRYRREQLAFTSQDRLDDALYRPITDSSNNSNLQQLAYNAQQRKALDAIFDSRVDCREPRPPLTGPYLSDQSSRTIQRQVDQIHNWKDEGSGDRSSETLGGVKPCTLFGHCRTEIQKVRNRLDTDKKDPRSQQLQLLDLYIDHFLGVTDAKKGLGPPRVLLLHGGPGVGKSALRDAIMDVATICRRYCLRAAFNSINAAEMGGQTTSSYISATPKIHSHRIGDFKAPVINDLRRAGFRLDSMVVIEECSTQAPWHLARFHRMCQCANDNCEDFGGSLVLLIGDLTQLGPVKAGPNLTQAIMDINLDPALRKRATKRQLKIPLGDSILPPKRPEDACYNADHPYTVGADLFTRARWYELTKQNRSLDPVHTKLLRRLYHGQKINFQALKDANYRILSRADNTDATWIRAPILVATNRERYTLTHLRAKQFGKFHGTPVLRWVTNYDHWNGRPSSPQYQNEALEDCCFYEYFVPGMEGFLTEGVQKDLRLVNGIPVKYHSIKFEEEHEQIVQEYLRRARPGEIITLPFRPLAINVEVFMPANTPMSVMDALKEFSLAHDQEAELQREGSDVEDDPDGSSNNNQDWPIILPIYSQPCKWSRPVLVQGGDGFAPSRVQLQAWFPVELAFSITVHKSEGRTLSRVIVALSQNPTAGCNFDHRKVHVALSRVRQREDIRLLLVGDTEGDQWHSLAYLEKLKPDPSIGFFFGGFRPATDDNPNEGWRTNAWNKDRANAAFRAQMNLQRGPA